VEEAQRHDPKVLVEVSAEGAREVECGVLEGFGSNPPDTSVVGEIVVDPAHEFYDFAAKYLPEEHTGLVVPADLPPAVVARIQELSAQSFEVLSVEGLARVDFFVLPDDRVVVNEINTMPGFTPSSMFPRMWDASGMAYPQLVDRLIQLALHRDTGLR
jgi:D-alanine-D-alanine ligase